MRGWMPISLGDAVIASSSVGFSTTRMTVVPIFEASSAVSMYSSSL